MFLSGYGIRAIRPSLNELGSIYTICFYPLKDTVGNWYHFFLQCLIEFTCKTTWAQYCFGRLLIIHLISLIDTDLLSLATLSCVCFGKLCFSRIGLFYLGYQNVSQELFIILFHYPFHVHKICSDVPSFISVLVICVLSLFS